MRRPFTFEDHDVVRFRAGFTLVELLVVIAIIGIMAALLLPTLSKGKASAQSVACKSNLRQLGIALNIYVSDYDKYPGNGAIHSGGIFIGFSAAGMNWLKSYLGEKHDTNLPFNVTPGVLTVLHCPAQNPIPPSPIGGIPGTTLSDSDYGYNELGTGWKDVRLKLGLGFIVEASGPVLVGQSAGTPSYVRPASIKAPSDLVAIADGDTWLAPNYPFPLGALEDRPHAGSLFLPHNANANVVFCDGHVEQANGLKWIKESDSARKRWNNDNQPHPETW